VEQCTSCEIKFNLQPENISIKVVGRCRPLTAEESSKGVKTIVKVSGDKILLEVGGKVC
jgi:hypothetical protein